jgi:anti-anti-sigma factor
MRIVERSLGEIRVIELHGRLLGPATDLLVATARRIAATGNRRLVLNLEDVPAIDAAGLGALATAYTIVVRQGGAFALASVAKRVHVLLATCLLDTVFQIFDSVEHAIAGGEPVDEGSVAAATGVGEMAQASMDAVYSASHGA